MTITTILAYLLIISYFAIRRSFRQGQATHRLQPATADTGSSQILLIGSFYPEPKHGNQQSS
jgi:hypothetical protein